MNSFRNPNLVTYLQIHERFCDVHMYLKLLWIDFLYYETLSLYIPYYTGPSTELFIGMI